MPPITHNFDLRRIANRTNFLSIPLGHFYYNIILTQSQIFVISSHTFEGYVLLAVRHALAWLSAPQECLSRAGFHQSNSRCARPGNSIRGDRSDYTESNKFWFPYLLTLSPSFYNNYTLNFKKSQILDFKKIFKKFFSEICSEKSRSRKIPISQLAASPMMGRIAQLLASQKSVVALLATQLVDIDSPACLRG